MTGLRINLDLPDFEVNEILIALIELKLKYRRNLQYACVREVQTILDTINVQYKEQMDKAKNLKKQPIKMRDLF